jgi:endonuclease/exonuclease/phosphatase family metal-dependent hydrolase
LLWTQGVAALVVLFPLMGFVLPGLRPYPGERPTMRVLSYNVNATLGGADKIAEQIAEYSPDVVLLQELGPAEPIASLLRAHYATVNVSTQFLLATRYPVVSSVDPERIPYYNRQRSPRFVEQVLVTPLGRVAFYNVHPLSPREGLRAVRGQGLRHEILSGRILSSPAAPVVQTNAGLRSLQVQAFVEAAESEPYPVVIGGDTNLPDLSWVYNRYLSHFQDGFTKAGWGFGYTFPTDRRPWMRIDRILATEGLRFVRFQVGTSHASDHLCVVADISGG